PSRTYPLSLHDALPISAGSFIPSMPPRWSGVHRQGQGQRALRVRRQGLHHFISYDLRTTYPKEATQKRGVLDVSSKRAARGSVRSEEHTSELQSRFDLV